MERHRYLQDVKSHTAVERVRRYKNQKIARIVTKDRPFNGGNNNGKTERGCYATTIKFK